MNYLARREYSRLELSDRLLRLGFESNLVEATLDRLEADNLLSDARYLQSFVRVKLDAGYGPRWLEFQLRGKGIERAAIHHHLESLESDWAEIAANALRRRYHAWPCDKKEQARRQRFLARRGFDAYQIQSAMDRCESDEDNQ